MTYVAATLLSVFLEGRKRLKVGRLALQDRRILFEYDPDFLASGIEISPFELPLRSGVMIAEPAPFDGLFGVFNDSLPDGWGRLLLDRAVERAGLVRGSLTPLDRLAYVGRCGMGALSYEPDFSQSEREPIVLKLDRLAADAVMVLAGEQGAVVDELLKLNGASAGARPKVVAQVSADRKRIIHGPGPLPAGYGHWMIKFPAQFDEADVGAIEYAYSRMARAAGLDMPQTHLFGSKRKRYFGIKRFDRDGDRRIHMHSLAGLLHTDHRTPSLDYDTFLKATQVLTKDATQVAAAFRLACFNVLAHNRDDHAKNFSYLLDDTTGAWSLAPPYDLTFSAGPGGEQSMIVMGEGRAPDTEHLRALAKKHGLKGTDAILDAVYAAIARWSEFAAEAGVSKRSAAKITARICPNPAKSAKPSKRSAAETATASKKKPAAGKRSSSTKTRKTGKSRP